MNQEKDIAYKHLKDLLSHAGSRPEGAEKLVDFAQQYSNDNTIQFESSLLHADFQTYAGQQQIQQQLADKMLVLAEKIYTVSPTAAAKEEQDYGQLQQIWMEKRKPREIVFSCEGLYKKFPRFELRDITVRLKAGEITGLVGENGNGKTTLLRIIAGELLHDKGTLTYGALQDGDNIDWSVIKSRVAYLPQELKPFKGTVKKSIQYAAALHGITSKQNDEMVAFIIQRLGLAEFAEATWQELSGGYKLRCALAAVLVWKPRLIILDEPLANLDINTQIRVLNDLRSLSQSIKHPIAVILSSQNIEEVEAVSDNIIVLKKGEIRFNDAIERLGETRNENMFEFKCYLEPDEVAKRLAGFNYLGLDYNGFSFFITTPLHVTETDLFNHCTHNDITLYFFSNTGISAKKLIVQTTLN